MLYVHKPRKLPGVFYCLGVTLRGRNRLFSRGAWTGCGGVAFVIVGDDEVFDLSTIQVVSTNLSI